MSYKTCANYFQNSVLPADTETNEKGDARPYLEEGERQRKL